MVELGRSNSNATESVASSEDFNQVFHDTYDEATIKFNRYREVELLKKYFLIALSLTEGH